MPALPPSNTRRLWVLYNDGVNDHKLMVRGDTDVNAGDLMDVVHNVLTELTPALYAISVAGAEFADVGTNVSNPVSWTGSSGYGSGAMPDVNAPREVSFEFRSADGRLGSYSIFGMNIATPPAYRILYGANADLDGAWALWVAAHNVGTLCTISGQKGVFKTYYNVNFNSYWEVQARG